MIWSRSMPDMASADDALPGRPEPAFAISGTHLVTGNPMVGPYPDGLETAVVAMGCFWGAERLYWRLPGVYSTAVGYAGGFTPNPTYEEACSGRTGHAEAVLIVFDPSQISFADLLQVFFDEHDPTQGMRQGNDVGTQYRSAIYTVGGEQASVAVGAVAAFNEALADAGRSAVTTEVAPLGTFYFAEEHHQQYLYKNPSGYCGLKGTGVTCAIPRAEAAAASTSTDPARSEP